MISPLKFFCILLSITSLLISCASKTEVTEWNKPYLKAILQTPILSDSSKIKALLGEPSQIESEGNEKMWTYTLKYKGLDISKVILWVNSEGMVTNKYINLFEETNDNMKFSELSKILGKVELVRVPDHRKLHYISSTHTFKDERAGISVDVNSARDNSVQHIFWSTPAP